MDSSHEFAKQGTFLNKAAAESIAEVLKESGIYIKKNTEQIWGAFIRKIQNTNISQDEDFQKFKEETIKSFDKFKQERY
jgi:hypothetical protein